MLGGKSDPYGGVTVDVAAEVSDGHDVPAFSSRLKESIAQWVAEGKRGIWLRVPSSHASLLGAAVDEGFEFHHCQPGYVFSFFAVAPCPYVLAFPCPRVSVGKRPRCKPPGYKARAVVFLRLCFTPYR